MSSGSGKRRHSECVRRRLLTGGWSLQTSPPIHPDIDFFISDCVFPASLSLFRAAIHEMLRLFQSVLQFPFYPFHRSLTQFYSLQVYNGRHSRLHLPHATPGYETASRVMRSRVNSLPCDSGCDSLSCPRRRRRPPQLKWQSDASSGQ